jgi:hypothetical protein
MYTNLPHLNLLDLNVPDQLDGNLFELMNVLSHMVH